MERIETTPNLADFFDTLIQEALQTERVEIAAGSRAYLVQLFNDFSHSDGLHRATESEERGPPALVKLYERARCGPPSERFDAWRHLGDVALFVAGLFGSYLQRRKSLVGLEYYVQMGSGAYGSAALYARRTGFGPILDELALKFRNLVDVLTRVGEATTLPVAVGIERLYDRWLLGGGSRDIHARLTNLGASPVLVGVGSA